MASSRAATKAVIQDDLEVQKRDLERQMEESRGSIAETVTEIKDAVAGEYESIKQGISDTFDWREQFRKHPIAWMVGGLSVGYVLGNSLAAAYSDTKGDNQLLSYMGALGDKFTGELSKQGMNILGPAVTGTVLIPLLNGQLKKAFGIDLSNLPQQLLGLDPGKGKHGKAKSKKKSRKKERKNGSKSKQAKKQK